MAVGRFPRTALHSFVPSVSLLRAAHLIRFYLFVVPLCGPVCGWLTPLRPDKLQQSPFTRPFIQFMQIFQTVTKFNFFLFIKIGRSGTFFRFERVAHISAVGQLNDGVRSGGNRRRGVVRSHKNRGNWPNNN